MRLGEFALQEFKGAAYTPYRFIVDIGLGQHFTGILVTLLLTTENKTIDILKEKKTDKILYGKKVSLYDLLHRLFTNALLNELILLIIVLFNLFLMGLICNELITTIGLMVEENMILNIIFSMMIGVNNMYWTFKNN